MAAIIVTSLNSQFTRRIMGPSRATFRATQNLHEFCYSIYYYYYYYYYYYHHYYNYYYYHHYLDYDKSWPTKKGLQVRLESKGRSNYFGIPNGTLLGFTLDSCKNLCRNATEISVGIFCRWNVTKVAAGISPVSPLSFSRRVLSLR